MNSETAYGRLVEPTTLEIRRLLPGTVERVWAYLTDSSLRQKWLAAGEMVLGLITGSLRTLIENGAGDPDSVEKTAA